MHAISLFRPKISPQLFLRVGLASVYLYSGVGMITSPDNWFWYMPGWMMDMVAKLMPVDTYLFIQGIGEILLAIFLLAWFLRPKVIMVVSVLGTLHIFAILLFVGIDDATFRDMGLLGAWLSLVVLARERSIKTVVANARVKG